MTFMTTLVIATLITVYLIIGSIVAEKYDDWDEDDDLYFCEPLFLIITIFWPFFLVWIIITRIAKLIIKYFRYE